MKHFSFFIILLVAIFSSSAEDTTAKEDPAETSEEQSKEEESDETKAEENSEDGSEKLPEEIPEELLDIADDYSDDARIFLVKDEEIEEGRREFVVFKFRTFQDDSDEDTEPKPFDEYMLRVTVQIKDRKTRELAYAQHEESVRKKKPLYMRLYEGTQWEFRIPFGDMTKARVNAYAIEFGFEKDGHFVPLVTDYDQVRSADEIINDEGKKVDMERTLKDGLWGDR